MGAGTRFNSYLEVCGMCINNIMFGGLLVHTWYSMQRASHYVAQLTVQPVRGFENGGHHFPAAESVLPAVDESPVDVSSSPRYHYFCISAHVASIYAIAALPLWRTARANNAAPTGIML